MICKLKVLDGLKLWNLTVETVVIVVLASHDKNQQEPWTFSRIPFFPYLYICSDVILAAVLRV